LLFFPLLLFPILLFAQENSASLLRELDQTIENHQFYSNQKEHTIDSLKQLIKPVMNDLQNRRFMINYMKDIECISRIPHCFCSKSMQIAISLNSKARDQAALNLPPSWELWDVQRGYRHSCKNPGNRSPRFLLCCKPRAI
jgi:hypothetical protein